MISTFLRLALIGIGWVGSYGFCRELAAHGRIESDRRVSLVLGTAVWAALLAFITELCSLGEILNRGALAIAWVLVDLALLIGCAWLARSRDPNSWLNPRKKLPEWKSISEAGSWPLDIRLMLLATTLFILFLGCVALLTPTTNWDSFTYHLPRVMHWVQHQSVAHYPTGSIGQLQMGPWAAFAQTHLFLSAGSDRFANLLQWSAMIGCVLTASLIARQIATGGPVQVRRIQALAALLVVTLPTGIVGSITSQTDWVAAFWFASLMSIVLSLRRDPKNLWYLNGAGLACGLGLLTKITFVLYVAPLGLVAGIWLLCRWRAPLQIAGRTLWFTALVLALFLPHALRNQSVFGSPTSAQSTQQNGQNNRFSLTGTLSNLIRNAALHTNTGIRPLTRLANESLRALHRLTGRGLNDPETTFPPSPFKFQEKFVVYDSETGNPYHLALILATLAVLLTRPRKNYPLLGYALVLVMGFAFFCMVLRWQQWNSRYHLAYFVLFMPLVPVVVVPRWPRWLVSGIAVGLTVFAGIVIAANQSRPVFHPAYMTQSRFRKMLFEQGALFAEKLETMGQDIVKSGCAQVGLKLNSDDAEYAVWLALRDHGFTGRIDHAFVENESARLPSRAPQPCLIITMSTNVPSAAMQQAFPYRMEYGLMSVGWSESSSHWHELIQFDFTTQSSRLLSGAETELLFDRRLIHLYVRSPRPGVLRLNGNLTDGTGAFLRDNTLRIASDAGYLRELSLNGQSTSLRVLVPIGTTRIRLSLLEPPAQTGSPPRLENFQWSFDANSNP